ncbi:hypothetical protein HIM_04113 [Hirsutella minnesotensis 3608]|uniref:Protein kinase domain-containing protein n=1 Tax=Hirsutella minnesotensis 3608 TaxID=1043627 RepID=A0A0F8A634_9HYPO|nr:hypothetical protein HIM_04113 [Hirsutella minnesotensis 3608]
MTKDNIMGTSVSHNLDISQIDGIGKGSFAQVGRIKQSEYVIKVASNDAHEHFDREKVVYERLQHHPNILHFHGEVCVTSSERTLRGLLLEYHPLGTLDKFISQSDLNLRRLEWQKQAIEAVRYVHSRGVIHGDLGCHNFLVKSDGQLALADFGGSRIDGLNCLEFSLARYTRPDTDNDGLEPTEKDDIFALGTILYEISTNQLLYQDLDDAQVRTRFLERQHPSFVGVSEALKLVIIRCWMGYYDSVDELVRDLDEFEAPSSCWPSARSLVALGLFSATVATIFAISIRRYSLYRLR